MQRWVILVLIALLGSCGAGSAETTTTVAAAPVEVVDAWLDAVAGPDLSALEPLVEPVGLAVVAAVENNLRSDELVGLLRNGMSDDLAMEYWAAFRDDFAVIGGEPWSALSAGEPVQVPDSREHTAVAIVTASSEGRVILRQTDSGWRIDFAATIGPALVGPLGNYLSSALGGDQAEVIATAYADAIVPGLDAAFALDPENSNLAFEVEYIRQLADSYLN